MPGILQVESNDLHWTLASVVTRAFAPVQEQLLLLVHSQINICDTTVFGNISLLVPGLGGREACLGSGHDHPGLRLVGSSQL